MTIGQHIYNGMGAAAWLTGFLIVFAGTLIAMFLIIYGVLLLADIKPARGKGVANRAGAPAAHYQSYGHAQTVGRHVRTRP